MARSVVFDVIANTRGFTKGMSEAQRSATQFQRHTSQLRSQLAGAFAGAAVIAGVRKVVAAARESQAVARQTAAVIKSTGGAAGLTAKQFEQLANSISRKVGVDDEVIQSGENILATFTGVRNELGRGNDIFNQATMAAVDMAAAMNHGEVTADGLQTANIQLGKALNDPIKGMAALRKVGVSFTTQQQDQIKTLVKSGHTLEAQKIILAELRKEFGGSAEANATASKKLAVAWGNLQEGLGKALIPAMERGATWLNRLVEGFNRLDQATHGVLSQVAIGAVALGGLAIAVGKVVSPVLDARKAWLAYRATKAAQIGVDAALGNAEAALAAKTTLAGDAAAASAGKFKLLSGAGGLGALLTRLGLLGAALGLGTFSVIKFQEAVRKGSSENEKFGGTVQLGTKFGGLYAAQQARVNKTVTDGADHFSRMAAASRDSATATQAGGAAAQTAAAKMAANAQKAQELTTKLQGLKQGFRDQVKSTQDAILGYDGLISKSGITARQVVRDLANQVTNFKTYAKDVQRLIRAGVNPAAIQELSQKGPQYVHALATGSNRELGLYKKAWADRQAAVKGSFAASMQKQYEDLVRKIRQMQAQINSLRGKNVNITANARATIAAQTVAWLRASHVKIPALAVGGRVTGPGGPTADRVPAMLSAGEHVWTAREVAAAGGHRAVEGMRREVRGMAVGGRVGNLQGFVNASAGAFGRGTQHAMDILAGTLGRALGKMIDKAMAGGVGGSAAIKRFIASVDRLPYRWGATGPAAYDCSGLVGAVYGKMRGDPRAGHGRRYFTTGSISTRVPGLRSGLGGLLNIGVTPGVGHMAGAYGGLGFEARSTRTGIFTGRAARSPSSFARRFHMAQGGPVMAWAGRLAGVPGVDVAGDPSSLTVVAGRFRGYDQGGWLPPGLSMAYNGTGRAEPVGMDYRALAKALAEELRANPPVVRVDELEQGHNARARGLGRRPVFG